MRPHVAIYLAAGIILFFGIISGFTHLHEAHFLRHTEIALQLKGDDLARYEAGREDHFDSAAESFTLAGTQCAIVFYTWKWRRQKETAEKSAS